MMLPNGWKKVKLGDVATISSGSTPLRSNKAYFENGNMPWVKTMDLTNGKITKTDECITELAAKKCKPYPVGTVLVAMYGGFNQIGRTGLLTFPASINQALAALQFEKDICSEYVLIYLNANVNRWRSCAASSRKDPNITSHDVEKFEIVLPPIEEQKKIAATLSVWDSAIEKMEKLIEAKESQKNSLVWEIIENQNNHIKIGKVLFDKSKWKVCKLSDVASGFDYGMNAAAKEYDGKNKYIRITDIDEISHKYNNDDVVSPEGELDGKYLVKKGDILFARTGASTGKSYLYDDRDGVLYFAGFLIRAYITNDNPFFVYIQTLTAKYQNWVKKMSARSGQPGINAEEYKELPIILPPINEQNVIADLFFKVEMETSLLKQQLENYKKQKQGLMQKLLTGQWRVK
jgi:type I restriction enzyme S subunit